MAGGLISPLAEGRGRRLKTKTIPAEPPAGSLLQHPDLPGGKLQSDIFRERAGLYRCGQNVLLAAGAATRMAARDNPVFSLKPGKRLDCGPVHAAVYLAHEPPVRRRRLRRGQEGERLAAVVSVHSCLYHLLVRNGDFFPLQMDIRLLRSAYEDRLSTMKNE
jgi:hypothetical protein